MAAHAAVIALAVAYEPEEPAEHAEHAERDNREPQTSSTAIEIVHEHASEPLEVVLLEERPAASAMVAPPDASSSAMPVGRIPGRRTRSLVLPPGTEQPSTTLEPGTIAPPGTIPPTRNTLLDMRGNEQPDLRLRSDLHDDLVHVPDGTRAVPEVESSGQLRPQRDGTYRSDQGVFTARVDKDGSVKLKDARNFRFGVPDPRRIPKMIGQGVGRWYERNDKTPGDPNSEPINSNRAAGGDTRPDHGETVPLIGGSFDLGDAFMRSHGQDPYASQKLKYLDSTRDERVQIGTKYRKQQLEQSSRLMQRNIDALWSRTADPAARKQGLFELWDDCAETGDPALVDGGQAARRMVVGVIRARFPPGSKHAFTAEELAGLNRKRVSKATFAPY